MRRKPRLAILAARPGDSEFRQLEPLVKKCGVMVMTILSEFLLFEVLPRESLRPSVIIASSTFPDEALPQTIRRIKQIDGTIPLVVATAENADEMERQVRCAGIFYFMMLPAHSEEVQQVTLSALRLNHGTTSHKVPRQDRAAYERRTWGRGMPRKQ